MKSISQIVGENLKQRMKELGLTQKTLADKMGLTQPNVHRWVSGEVMPDKITQKKLCKVLDCPIERLIQVDGQSDLSSILNTIDSRLKAIEESLMPKKEEAAKYDLDLLAERLIQKASALGVSPYEVLLQEIAEDEQTPPRSDAQSTLIRKKSV